MDIKVKRLKYFALVLLTIISFSASYSSDFDTRLQEKKNLISCGKKRGGGGVSEGGSGGGNIVEVGYVLLKITNANGLAPVGGAEIYVNGTPTSLSSENGTVYFSLPPGEYTIRVIAKDFAPYTFRVRVAKDELSHFDVKLAPYRFQGNLNTATGGVVEDRSTGLKIAFQGGGMKRKSDGTIYAGDASVFIAYLDPQRTRQLFAFPGNFVGVLQNGEKVLLETFGPIEVRVISNTGEELDLPNGVTAYVEFPIPDSLIGSTPNSVPLWSLNEATGEWRLEGMLHKTTNENGKLVLAGYVSHFSWWNPDIPSDTTCVQGVLKDDKGEPIAGAQVWSEGVDYTGADYTGATRKTGSDGKFFVFVRKGSKAKIIASVNGVKKELGEVQTTGSYPSYYLKDWLQNPSSAWSVCPGVGDFTWSRFKIILRWGNKRCDLDLHITGPKSSGRFHIATKVWGQVHSNPYAEIEGDDYPEIAYLDPTMQGVYRVSVFHNNPNSTSCGRLLKDSGALIQVWHRGRVVFTASPHPHSGNGDLWKAIDITVNANGDVSITEIREIVDGDYCSPYHPNPSDEQPCPQNSPPSISVTVPSVVDGASVVHIPYTASDPDGDNVYIQVLQDGVQGEFYLGNNFIAWHVPDVNHPKTVQLTIKAYDRKGGNTFQTSSVTINPPKITRIWEITDLSGGSVFWDIEVLPSGQASYAINDQWWADIVVRISSGGQIEAQRNFLRVFDVAVGQDGVYIAQDLGAGIFALGKYSFDLQSILWETALTTSGRHFVKLHTTSDGVYVVFSTTSDYIIRKYSSDGSIAWSTTTSRAGNFSRCHDRCMKINPSNGDIYISIFEDFTSGSDQQRILRISSAGNVISTKLFYDWSPVVVLPYGNSVFVVRLWLLLEEYDLNLNNLRKSVNIWSYPELEDFWISELAISSGYIYAFGGKSIYNSNDEFVRESMTLMKFGTNLELIYGKVIGIRKESDSERLLSAYIFGNHIYVGGGYEKADVFFPLIVKYAFISS